MYQKSLYNTTTSFLLAALQNLLANGLEIDKLTKQMKLYPSESLEEKFYLGLMIRKIIFIPPPTENTDLEGPMLLMASRQTLKQTDTTQNCTTDSEGVTTCTNATTDGQVDEVPEVSKAGSLLLSPKNMFQFLNGIVLGTGLIN